MFIFIARIFTSLFYYKRKTRYNGFQKVDCFIIKFRVIFLIDILKKEKIIAILNHFNENNKWNNHQINKIFAKLTSIFNLKNLLTLLYLVLVYFYNNL